MQFSRFSNGGFVIHKITGDFKGKVSAWFDASGSVLDAEQIVNNRSRRVVRGGSIWKRLQSIGSAWKSKAKSNPPKRRRVKRLTKSGRLRVPRLKWIIKRKTKRRFKLSKRAQRNWIDVFSHKIMRSGKTPLQKKKEISALKRLVRKMGR